MKEKIRKIIDQLRNDTQMLKSIDMLLKDSHLMKPYDNVEDLS